MSRKTESLFKGMGAGLAAGIAAGVIGTAIMTNKNKSKKLIGKAVKKIETAMDSVQDMFSWYYSLIDGKLLSIKEKHNLIFPQAELLNKYKTVKIF